MDIRQQAIHEYLVEGKTYRQLAKKYNGRNEVVPAE